MSEQRKIKYRNEKRILLYTHFSEQWITDIRDMPKHCLPYTLYYKMFDLYGYK